MGLSATAICAPDGTDGLALHVAHSLHVNFGRKMQTLCGDQKHVTDDMVPLISTSNVNYGYGYFVELENGKGPEWDMVVGKLQWLAGAKRILCISPELRGIGSERQLAVLRKLCDDEPDAPGELHGRPLWSVMND